MLWNKNISWKRPKCSATRTLTAIFKILEIHNGAADPDKIVLITYESWADFCPPVWVRRSEFKTFYFRFESQQPRKPNTEFHSNWLTTLKGFLRFLENTNKKAFYRLQRHDETDAVILCPPASDKIYLKIFFFVGCIFLFNQVAS